MRYLKRYEEFIFNNINSANKKITKGVILVERQVLKDFSESFWDMSLKSSVFTDEEKGFIKENLFGVKVDLVKESWIGDTFNSVIDRAKEVGGDIWDKVKNKINIIKDNIKNICKGISDFVKSLLKSIGDSVILKSNKLKDVVKSGFPEKIKSQLSKVKPSDEDLGNELKQLQSTYTHLSSVVKAGLFTKEVDSSDDSVIKNAEEQVGELENELKLESQSYDILNAFYIKEDTEYKIDDTVEYKKKDGSKGQKKITKIDGDTYFFKDNDDSEFSKSKEDIIRKIGSVGKVWGGFTKWVLDMEQATPPVEGKAVWWIKFILKVITLILSPIVKSLEVAAKFISSNVLKGSSHVSKYFHGPGTYDFMILSGIISGIPALITEFSLVSHKMPDPYGDIFEIVSHFLADAAGFKILIMIFGSICTTMTLAQLLVEFKHLFTSHTEH